METILVVDDEKNYLINLEALLSEESDYEILTAESGVQALQVLKEHEVDLVITDLKMPGMDGLQLLEEAKKMMPGLPVIVLTADGTIDTAVEAVKKGAYDYLTKAGYSNDELMLRVSKALEVSALVKEKRLLSEELSQKYGFDNLVGKSKPMQKTYELIRKVADTKATVLIIGESGTGKELIARSIHFNSRRSGKPYISVNCTALTESLLESELFGHEKGSFTGAIAGKKGRFELADKGTLFLDEVGEMSTQLQVKLLRVLQEMEFERVGGTRTLKVDVRIVAASNKDLRTLIKKGTFREDLFYRLNVVHILVPPLRERPDDILLLVNHFIKKYAIDENKRVYSISPDALRRIYEYDWPGNVRELEHVIERAVILSSGSELTVVDLPEEFQDKTRGESAIDQLLAPHTKLQDALEQMEEMMIRNALKKAKFVQSQAAEALGISRGLMGYKIKKYNISLS
ncbi:MAG: sigma-54-dependent Fis family transcriptional regulator [Deltaproteobacteria bacterium]|nr:sigma-54-dependent Fis family transcriptional regulator [Deltaproteobacteria bacterium]